MTRFDRLELSQPPADEQSADVPPRDHSAEHDWLAQADRNRRVGHYENALRFYSRALEEDKRLANAWVGQVQMLVLLDELPEAELWARKALEILQSNGDLLAARAQALYRLGDRMTAWSCCDASLGSEGHSTYRWQVRGELLLQMQPDTATHCFAKAEQLDRDWLVAVESALILLFHKQASRAHAHVRRALESAPDQYYAWYVCGKIEAALGLRRPARESFEHCLRLCSGHADALAGIGDLERPRGVFKFLRSLWIRRHLT